MTSAAVATLPTPLERITCAVIQSGMIPVSPADRGALTPPSLDDMANAVVRFARLVDKKLREASGH